jgi:hypothetical protein
MANKRINDARIARPTGKVRCTLLAGDSWLIIDGECGTLPDSAK